LFSGSAAIVFAAVADGQQTTTTTYGGANTASTWQDVRYECEITNLWTPGRHPRLYPTDDASWSAPVLVSHSDLYHVWGPGSMATPGIEQMAETGEANTLVREFTREAENVGDYSIGEVLDVSTNSRNSQTLHMLAVSSDTPYISSITAVTPSPDWFTGFYDFDARNSDSGNWYDWFQIETFPWDSGTQRGTTYVTDEPPRAEPNQLPIAQLLPSNIDQSSGVFLSDGLNEVRSVLRWSCRIIVPPSGEGPYSAGGGDAISGDSDGDNGGSSSSSASSFLLSSSLPLLPRMHAASGVLALVSILLISTCL